MSKLKRIICECCGTVLGVLKLSHLAKRIFSPQIGNPENMQLLFHRQTLLIPSCNPNLSLWLPWAIVLYLTAIIIAILRKLSVFFMSINGKVEVSCYLRAEPPFSQQRVFGEGLLLSIVSSINRRRLNFITSLMQNAWHASPGGWAIPREGVFHDQHSQSREECPALSRSSKNICWWRVREG